MRPAALSRLCVLLCVTLCAVVVGCSEKPAATEPSGGDTATPTAAPTAATPAPAPEPEPEPEPEVVVRVTRTQGDIEPSLHAGEPLNGRRVKLGAKAEVVVDHAGSRWSLYGPGVFAFQVSPRPVLLVGRGVFALQRHAGGPRGAEARVAFASGELVAATGAQMVGSAVDADVRVEVLAGAVRVALQDRLLGAGQLARFTPAGIETTARPPGRLEDRLEALLAESPQPKNAVPTPGEATRGALRDALMQFEATAPSPLPEQPTEDPLARRKALAATAAQRIEARETLGVALDRARAEQLTQDALADQALVSRALAALAGH